MATVRRRVGTKREKLRELVDKDEYLLKKRLPRKFPKRKNDIYVNNKTNFNAQLERCRKLLDSGNEVMVHGLGAAVGRAMNLALQLGAGGQGTVSLDANTSTVELLDDLEPDNDELEHETWARSNSAIHIRVFRQESAASATGFDVFSLLRQQP